MKIYFDTSAWSALSRLSDHQLAPLVSCIRAGHHQVLLSVTALGEMHAVREGQAERYERHDRVARLLAFDRILEDPLALMSTEILRLVAQFRKGVLADEAARVDGSIYVREPRLSWIKPFQPLANQRQWHLDRKQTNKEKAARFKRAYDDEEEWNRRVDFFSRYVTTSKGTEILRSIRNRHESGRTDPFIECFREGVIDAETAHQANEFLVWLQIRGDMEELPSLDGPHLTAAALLLKKYPVPWEDPFWKWLVTWDNDRRLPRLRTHGFVLHYLIANKFAGDRGTFWSDAQHGVFLNNCRVFATTDDRFHQALTSPPMVAHMARIGRTVYPVKISESPLAANQVIEAVKRCQ